MALTQTAFTKIEASSGTSVSAALSRTPTAGNTIAVGASAFWSTGSSPVLLLAVSGSTNGSYTKVGAAVDNNDGSPGATNTLGLFYFNNVAAVAETVTITGGTGTAGVVGLLTELAGYTGTVTVDIGGTPTNTGASTSATSTALTNSQTNSIFVCAVGTSGNGTGSFSPGGSWASSSSETNNNSFPTQSLDFVIVSSVASQTDTDTLDISRHWATCIAAFSDTPASGTVGKLVGPMQNTKGLVVLQAVKAGLPW